MIETILQHCLEYFDQSADRDHSPWYWQKGAPFTLVLPVSLKLSPSFIANWQVQQVLTNQDPMNSQNLQKLAPPVFAFSFLDDKTTDEAATLNVQALCWSGGHESVVLQLTFVKNGLEVELEDVQLIDRGVR